MTWSPDRRVTEPCSEILIGPAGCSSLVARDPPSVLAGWDWYLGCRCPRATGRAATPGPAAGAAALPGGAQPANRPQAGLAGAQ